MIAVMLPSLSVTWPTHLLVVLWMATLAAVLLVGRANRVSRRRLVLALVIAGLLARPLSAVICPSCTGCDPWWLEWFWICIP